jgi:hypothetical protein
MSGSANRFRPVVAVLVATLAVAACEKQAPEGQTGAAVPAPATSVPPAASEPAAAAKGADFTPLAPAEEKRLVEMAKARKAADGATVWEVIENAQAQRPNIFKVAIVDIDYKKDGTPAAVAVCYWIGANRLEHEQSCQSIGWEIGADRRSLQPYNMDATKALEAGRNAFLQAIDAMYEKKCGVAPGGGKPAKFC